MANGDPDGESREGKELERYLWQKRSQVARSLAGSVSSCLRLDTRCAKPQNSQRGALGIFIKLTSGSSMMLRNCGKKKWWPNAAIEDSSFGKGHPVQKEMTHGEVKEMTTLDPEL